MFRKFNWGTGIATFIGLFLIGMGVLIYASLQQRFDLVEQEYYPQGLEYQKQIDKMANTAALSGKLKLEQNENELLVLFPDDMRNIPVIGTIHIFRPSDENADFTDSIKLDSSLVHHILISRLVHGKYIAKISWEAEGKQYYAEESIGIVK